VVDAAVFERDQSIQVLKSLRAAFPELYSLAFVMRRCAPESNVSRTCCCG
jgi:hypothetical protein